MKKKYKPYQCDRCDKVCPSCESLQERVWDLEFEVGQLKAELDGMYATMCSDWENNKPERF